MKQRNSKIKQEPSHKSYKPFKALQEAMDRIETLEAKVAALEGN